MSCRRCLRMLSRLTVYVSVGEACDDKPSRAGFCLGRGKCSTRSVPQNPHRPLYALWGGDFGSEPLNKVTLNWWLLTGHFRVVNNLGILPLASSLVRVVCNWVLVHRQNPQPNASYECNEDNCERFALRQL